MVLAPLRCHLARLRRWIPRATLILVRGGNFSLLFLVTLYLTEDEPFEPSPPDNPPARSRTHGSGSLGQSGNTRPRRSASLSDALSELDPNVLFIASNTLDAANEDDPYLYHQNQNSNYQSQSNPRATTSLGFSTADGPANNDGPRRVMMDERERQHADVMSVHKSRCAAFVFFSR